ncbi:MAG: hypothetical protein HQK76_04340 [Desulfobacterales bacterium]|nr:hypothetical protein [Desulfobacterales bacterium]
MEDYSKGYSEVFLSYANNSLIEDPKNYSIKILKTIKTHRKVLELMFDINDLSKMIQFIENPQLSDTIQKPIEANFADFDEYQEELMMFDLNNLSTMINLIIEFIENPQLADKIQKPIEANFADFDEYEEELNIYNLLKCASEAVYGYKNGTCETKCPMRKKVQGIIDEKLFTGKKRLKCFQCYQLYFINTLKTICNAEYFVLNEQILDKLREEGLPDDIINKIKELINNEFKTEKKFVAALKKILRKEDIDTHQTLILKHTSKTIQTINFRDIEGLEFILSNQKYIMETSEHIVNNKNMLKIKTRTLAKTPFLLYNENSSYPHLTFLDYSLKVS